MQPRSVYSVTEQETIEIPLQHLLRDGSLFLYPEVIGRDFFRIHLKRDRLALQAAGFVGLIPINDLVAIDVRPRVPIRNLEHMLSVVDQEPESIAPHRRYYQPSDSPQPSLLPTMAQALIDAMAPIRAQGLFREFRQARLDTSLPRGRVLVSPTITKYHSRGLRHRVVASWFEHTVDNQPNRCIRYAVWYLAQRIIPLAPTQERRTLLASLNLADYLLAGSKLDMSRAFLESPLVRDPTRLPTIRDYYLPAIHVAKAIIKDRGVKFDEPGGEIHSASMVVSLHDTFEKYMRSVLASRLQHLLPRISVLDGNKAPPQGGRKALLETAAVPYLAQPINATPDIVLQRNHPGADPAYPVVIEVKYKPIELIPDRQDLNQAIAYAASYSAASVLIVLPSGPHLPQGLSYLGRLSSHSLYTYSFDLSAPDYASEEAQFAATVGSLALL